MRIHAASAEPLLAARATDAGAAGLRARTKRGVVSRTAGVWQIAPCGEGSSPLTVEVTAGTTLPRGCDAERPGAAAYQSGRRGTP